MTNSEAQCKAEEIIETLTTLVVTVDDRIKLVKMAKQLNTLLEQIVASKAGLLEPDQPLFTPWSLYDTSLLEMIRLQWIPTITETPALTVEQIFDKYRQTVSEKED